MLTSTMTFPINVAACQDAFDARRQRALQAVADYEHPPRSTYGEHVYGVPAIANLALGREIAAGNAQLRQVAAWYQLPHPTGRDHRGEPDFVAMKLCRAFHHPLISRHLEPETRGAIQRYFLTERYDSKYGSENHALIYRVSRYLMAQTWPEETFTQYGNTGSALVEEDWQWLLDFLRFRAERGWGEFDSSCYLVPDWEALTTLFDYTHDAELRRQAGMMLDLLLTDMAVDSLNGMYCGAHGRIYPGEALDHSQESTYALQHLYFGLGNPAYPHKTLLAALLSDYRPHPLVIDIAINRPEAYENRERKHLHLMSDTRPSHPLEGSIRKYTYYTPDYVLGCIQFQDPYPADTTGDSRYAHHQQHEWDLTIASGTNVRLFTHHPGDFNEHNYWTGDLNCCCGHFFQHRSVVLALYDIPANQPYQFIHAHVPRAVFDEVWEDGHTLCLRAGSVYAALTFLDDYAWVRDGDYAECEVISSSARTGVICEVGKAEDFGTFSDFRTEVLANPVHFDRETLRLTYTSRRAGTLTIETQGMREVNGQPMNLDYATYDCPYMHSMWQSGVVELRHGNNRLTLDFHSTDHHPATAVPEGTKGTPCHTQQ